MTTRYRLTARAQFHGEVREAGYVFILGDGELGPHKTVPKGAEDSQIADHIGGANGMVDAPLYRALSDEENAAIDEAEHHALGQADLAAEETAAHAAKDEVKDEPADPSSPAGSQVS